MYIFVEGLRDKLLMQEINNFWFAALMHSYAKLI